jgi:hypothetical protein
MSLNRCFAAEIYWDSDEEFYETKINQYKEAQQCANLAKDVDSLNDCSKIFEREIKAYQEKNKGK